MAVKRKAKHTTRAQERRVKQIINRQDQELAKFRSEQLQAELQRRYHQPVSQDVHCGKIVHLEGTSIKGVVLYPAEADIFRRAYKTIRSSDIVFVGFTTGMCHSVPPYRLRLEND